MVENQTADIFVGFSLQEFNASGPTGARWLGKSRAKPRSPVKEMAGLQEGFLICVYICIHVIFQKIISVDQTQL